MWQKATILLLARYESPFLFGLFMNKLINSVVNVFFTCIFRNYRFYEFILKLVLLCCFTKLLIRVKTLLSRGVSSKSIYGRCCHSSPNFKLWNNTGTLSIKIALNRTYRNHYCDSRFTLTVIMPEMMPQYMLLTNHFE